MLLCLSLRLSNNILSTERIQTDSGATQIHTQLVPRVFPWGKAAGREDDCLPSILSKIKNAWMYTSTHYALYISLFN